ncbi:BnaC04g54700D [Brassica napus]|uniref:BnaC04g54700D protein n=1 Tax=Brassica napus TaxID=3708 RepID=A0A078JDP6_BRANA|nr:BnaC04g54700D [Brassica napus]
MHQQNCTLQEKEKSCGEGTVVENGSKKRANVEAVSEEYKKDHLAKEDENDEDYDDNEDEYEDEDDDDAEDEDEDEGDGGNEDKDDRDEDDDFDGSFCGHQS